MAAGEVKSARPPVRVAERSAVSWRFSESLAWPGQRLESSWAGFVQRLPLANRWVQRDESLMGLGLADLAFIESSFSRGDTRHFCKVVIRKELRTKQFVRL